MAISSGMTLPSHETGIAAAQPTPAPEHWQALLQAFADHRLALPARWTEIFGPLRQGSKDNLMVVGQIGQTIDGRIATHTGQSKYINGAAGLTHLHRLRALVDAVVVGVGTAIADNPMLTVRMIAGNHPARVVIDPNNRLHADANMFKDDGARRIVITKAGQSYPVPSGVEVLYLSATDGRILPQTILQGLSALGFKRILIEGGADTVSRFIQAGCMDRLHVIVAPIIMGSGRAGFSLPAIDHMDEAKRLTVRTHQLDDEVLFDCDLSAQRIDCSGRTEPGQAT